jgi:iron complex outermembrane receptor protein
MFKYAGKTRFSRQPMSQAVAFGVLLLAGNTAFSSAAQAQGSVRKGATAILEEVVVTARKRAENSQDVPVAMNAFNSDQLTALKFRDLSSLAVTMPNVALDDQGTTRGVANFSIRGVGITSSIVSIDPAVGVFIDGVYLGVNNGIVFDTFDLESIEVLRGPQGILFGRNVTGGAVLMNTKKPSDRFEASIRTTFEDSKHGGNNTYLMGSIGGPVGDTLALKLTVYRNDDDGGLTNEFDGNDHGAIEQNMIRPVVVWTPTDALEMVFRYEYADTDADGPSGQSHTSSLGSSGSPLNHDSDGFSFSIDEPGWQDTESTRFTFETNWRVGENGVITNIFGYRDLDIVDRLDIDSQPVSRFHATVTTGAEQLSNELRYNARVGGRSNVTAGVYYFENDVIVHESREIFGGIVTNDGGGVYDVETRAVFGAIDYDLSDKLVMTAGLRYTQEEKSVGVASLTENRNAPCFVPAGTCVLDFLDDDDWDSWSPKVGVTYNMNDDTMLYAHWTRGFRSGGYNLRNSASDKQNNGPGPFDQETVTNYEAGFKMQFPGGRLNGAFFYIEGEDMQRAVIQMDPGAASGLATVIKNAGDTETLGFELDGVVSITERLLLSANVGYIDAEYSDVSFDINGDGLIDGLDKGLDLPRAAEWTYTVALNHDLQLGNWLMSSRVSFSHRDESFGSDDNTALLPEQDIVDAGIDFYSNDGRWMVGIYGRNLTDEVKWGGETLLPASLGGGTFAPLAKGARYGVEVTYNFF